MRKPAFWLWYSRIILLLPSLVLFVTGILNLLLPVGRAAAFRMALGSATAITDYRVANGAFQLAISMYVWYCLVNKQRLRAGLWFFFAITVLDTTTRIFSAVMDGYTPQSLRLLIAGSVLTPLLLVAIIMRSGETGMPEPATGRALLWYNRIVVGALSLLFILFGVQFLTDPDGMAQRVQVVFHSPMGITNYRVAGGAFPLAIALYSISCVLSNRLMDGVRLFFVVIVGITVVRFAGLLADGATPGTLMLLRPEVVATVALLTGFLLEIRRRRSLNHSKI